MGESNEISVWKIKPYKEDDKAKITTNKIAGGLLDGEKLLPFS